MSTSSFTGSETRKENSLESICEESQGVKLVFMNYVNSYHGRSIVKELKRKETVSKETQESVEDEEEDEQSRVESVRPSTFEERKSRKSSVKPAELNRPSTFEESKSRKSSVKPAELNQPLIPVEGRKSRKSSVKPTESNQPLIPDEGRKSRKSSVKPTESNRPSILDEESKSEKSSTILESIEEEEEEECEEECEEICDEFCITGTCHKDFIYDVEIDQVIDQCLVPNFVLEQDFTIYDLNFNVSQVNEALQVVKILETWAKSERMPESKKFLLLITNPMTWARTGFEGNISEDQYRSRRAHPCYRRHIRLEQEATNLQTKYPEHIRTLILCPGVTFGHEEDVLHYFFNHSFHNNADINMIEPGTNNFPLLHVDDLGKIIKKLIRELPEIAPEIRYIFATNPNLTYLQFNQELCKTICGPISRLRISSKEEMFLIEKSLMTQRVLDKLTLNVKFDVNFLKDFEFTGSAQEAVEQYYEAWNLKPLKILIHGPPNSGKTTLARALASYYAVHYINPDDIIDESKCRLHCQICKAENYLENATKFPTDEFYAKFIEETTQNLEEWKKELESLEEICPETKSNLLLKRLQTNGCWKNQGYVIDGLSYDIEDVSKIFLEEVEEEKSETEEQSQEEQSQEESVTRNESQVSSNDPTVEECGQGQRQMRKDLVPDIFIYLRFSDEFMEKVEKCSCQRYHENKCDVFSESSDEDDDLIDQSIMIAIKSAEQKRLESFLDSEYEDKSLYTFMLDHGIHPMEVIANQNSAKEVYQLVRKELGPRNEYMLSEEKREDEKRIQEEMIQRAKEKEALKRQRQLERERDEREKRLEEEYNKKLELKRREVKQIEAHSLPLKNYLMKYIIPKLTEGLVEVAKIRPAEPLEYLADYLFKHNTEGKMFDPCLSPDIIKHVLECRRMEIDSEVEEYTNLCGVKLNCDDEDTISGSSLNCSELL